MDVEMTSLDRVDSLAERAYRALREQIATGGLAPGERVTERGLGALSPTAPRLEGLDGGTHEVLTAITQALRVVQR